MADAPADPDTAPRASGRRHRPWLGVSGFALLVAMFLPAVHACESPAYPFELPPFWPPYLLGGAFGIIAFARTPRAFVRAAWLVRGLLVLYALASATLCLFDLKLGAIELTIAVVLLALNGAAAPPDERRVAVTAIFAGSLQCVWFAPWCLDSGAMIGVYVSLFASVGVVIGGALWTSDLPSPPPRPPPPPDLPRARVLPRD